MIKLNRPDCQNPIALKTNYRHPDNKNVLRHACFDKCMYCESKISHVYFGDVEHIKPKSKYPELEFEWANLGYVCAKCNGNKSDTYSNELPFVNPFDEDPSEFLVAMGTLIWSRPGKERGDFTVKVIELNRPDLIERRLERIKLISVLADKLEKTQDHQLKLLIEQELKNELTDDKPYTLAARKAFENLVNR
jgi:hypothetical protein